MISRINCLFFILLLSISQMVSNAYADEVFLISGDENTGFSAPLVVWKYQSPSLMKVKTIEVTDNSYARMVEMWRDKGTLGVWIDDLSGNNQSEFLLLSLRSNMSVKRTKLPVAPFLGGATTIGGETITFGESSMYMTNVDEEIKEVQNSGFQWDQILVHGTCLQRGSAVNLFVTIESDGSLFYRSGANRYRSKIALPEKLLGVLSMVNKSGGVVEINDSNIFMVGTMGVESLANQGVSFIYYKKTGEWVHEWTDFPASSPKSFGEWVVTQIVVERKKELHDASKSTRKNLYFVNGMYVFHNTLDQRKFNAELREDSEVLDIDGEGWVLYRVGATLYKAQILQDHLGKPIKLITDENIKNVHWGMWTGKNPSVH